VLVQPTVNQFILMPQFKTSVGRVAWSNLIEARTSDYGKTEWTLGLVLDENATNEMLTRMDDELESYRKKNPLHAKFPPLASLKNGIKPSEIKDEEGNKTPDEGNFLAVFKRQTTWKSKQGDTNKQNPPRIYDSVGRILTEPLDVPRGSRGLAVYEHGIYNNPGNKGISLRLVGFQIAELAEGNDVKLEAIDGGTFVVEPEEEALT
jgi:hypothetical protein